ncbi:hypothetical protein ACFX15_019173 [Malus domestica]
MSKQLTVLGGAVAMKIRCHNCNGIQRTVDRISSLLWFFQRTWRRGADAEDQWLCRVLDYPNVVLMNNIVYLLLRKWR